MVNKRMRVWMHNGHLGCARMIQTHLMRIIQSDSVTDESKRIAIQMHDLSYDLSRSLKTRKD